MSIEIIKNFDLPSLFKRARASLEAEIGKIGSDVVAEIDVRTASGKDRTGATFKPYAPGTIQQKRRTGRQTTPPNLTQTGQMLSAVDYRIEKTGNTVDLLIGLNSTDAANKARWNRDNGREFMGLTREQQTRIFDRIKRAYASGR